MPAASSTKSDFALNQKREQNIEESEKERGERRKNFEKCAKTDFLGIHSTSQQFHFG